MSGSNRTSAKTIPGRKPRASEGITIPHSIDPNKTVEEEAKIILEEEKYNLEATLPKEKQAIIWAYLASYLPSDEQNLQKFFVQHAEYSLCQTRRNIMKNKLTAFRSLAYSVRDRLIERWKDTEMYFRQIRCKRVYYLSLEYLLGRSLQNAISNLNLTNAYTRALRNLGIHIEDLYDQERDAGLGNGGLGRLAACFMDSLATMNYPAMGYGLRYKYGMFYQAVKNGYQVELPDYWLSQGNAWEIERFDVQYKVHFGGRVVEESTKDGKKKFKWEPSEEVVAIAYDVPVPGYNTYNSLNMRLWSSKPSNEFDLRSFNEGDYFRAVQSRHDAETITSVLYPNDNTTGGKELRIKQQYFFVCATLQDIIRRFRRLGLDWEELPNNASIQLNDTHPALAIPELMRILVDEKNLPWKKAWAICKATFFYTNHTVLPEALEKWSVDLISRLLPRHINIIFMINHNFLESIKAKYPGDQGKLSRMSIIQEGGHKMVRMANLAIIGSSAINGVAEIHSELLKTNVFPDFYDMFPSMFTNVTNGVTPRRWLHTSNNQLSELITRWLKTDDWLHNFSLLKELRQFADDKQLQKKWMKIKKKNKQRLADWIEEHIGVKVGATALFDVQVKRFHEYKRQFMNILAVMYRYREIKGMSDEEKADVVPKVVMFGGKAAPGYHQAKRIIKLVSNVAKVVNNDPETSDLLKCVFLPNYNVSLAELIIPASDLSQHISTAGMEASGTSNMKFSINGGLIIGTMDGANIEIRQEIGEGNMFIFGKKAHEVEEMRKQVRERKFKPSKRWETAIELLRQGFFGNFPESHHLVESVTNGNDYYLVSVDFDEYLDALSKVDETYKDTEKWAKMSILATAGMGKFSSDRSINDYAKNIWKLKPCKRPGPVPVSTEKLSDAGLVNESLARSPIGVSPFSPEASISLERLEPHERTTIKYFSPNPFM